MIRVESSEKAQLSILQRQKDRINGENVWL